MPEAIYTAASCKAAYKLNWSLAVFWNASPPPAASWLDALGKTTEPDGVRLLEHRLVKGNISQFLVSTRPQTTPSDIARSVKGHLQYLVRTALPKPFRRNYGLRSVGDAGAEVVEGYVGRQTEHHPMADARVQRQFNELHIDGSADLTLPRVGGHAQFLYNLHVVLVHCDRGKEVRAPLLGRRRERVLAIAAKKGHLLSRGQLLTDHLHLTLGCALTESPQQVALGYMNNLAYAEGMKPLFEFSYYVGTFGEYDLDAVRRGVRQDRT
jgi:REP element-mobilizing transposase RayT